MQFPRLLGCVNDIKLVSIFLRTTTDIEPCRIHELTASEPPPNLTQTGPTEPQENWPTYLNIIRLFEHVTEKAKKDDLVYIHYAGHGARAASIFADLKRDAGDLNDSLLGANEADSAQDNTTILDEALVSTDIATADGRYLRDLEIAVLLRRMAKKGLLVTTVFDCCHAGGLNRNKILPGEGVRGIQMTDYGIESTKDVSRISSEELELVCKESRKIAKAGEARSARVMRHWLLGSGVYGQVFFSACSEAQQAKERDFGGIRQGVFTYSLITTLNGCSSLTGYQIHNEMSNQLGKYGQNPQMTGEHFRVFFRSETLQLFHEATTISEILPQGPTNECMMVLSAGSMQGVRKDDIFDIWPRFSNDFDKCTSIGRVVVQKEWDTWACVKLISKSPGAVIEKGCPAVQVFRKCVRLISPAARDVSSTDLLVREAFERNESGLRVTQEKDLADFEIQVLDNGSFEVHHGNGTPFQNQIRFELNTYNKLCHVLKHVSKFKSVFDIHDDNESKLHGVSFELGHLVSETKPQRRLVVDVHPLNAIPQSNPGGTFRVTNKASVILRIKNETDVAVKFAVLLLEPSWEVSQIHPGAEGMTYEELGAHSVLDIPMLLEKDFPDQESETSTFKIFLSTQPTNFRWLQLPPLQEPTLMVERPKIPKTNNGRRNIKPEGASSPFYRELIHGNRNAYRILQFQVCINAI